MRAALLAVLVAGLSGCATQRDLDHLEARQVAVESANQVTFLGVDEDVTALDQRVLALERAQGADFVPGQCWNLPECARFSARAKKMFCRRAPCERGKGR